MPSLLFCLLAAAIASAAPIQFTGGRLVGSVAVRPGSAVEVPQVPVATNGTTFFTAWVADRNGDTAVFGARLALDGTLLDPLGLRLASTDASYGSAGVVWNGREWVVFGPESAGIVVTRVTSDGAVTSTRHIAEPGVFLVNTAMWNGSQYALIIREKTSSGAVVTKLLVLAPNLAIEKTRALNEESARAGGVSLATDGTAFLLVWEVYKGAENYVVAQRLDSTGRATEEPRVVPLGAEPSGQYLGSFWPAVSWNGSGYTIVWMGSGIWGITMNALGEFGTPFRITGEQGSFPSIAWDGTQHVVTWTHVAYGSDVQFHLRGARVTPSGEVTPLPTLSTSGAGEAQAALAANHPQSGSNPSGFLGIWFGDVFSGNRHASLTNRYFDQVRPLLAAGATKVLTTWGEGSGIYAARLGDGGASLDGAGILVGLTSRNEQLIPQVVASNGEVYLVVWQASNEIRFARLSEDGTLIDPVGGVRLTDSGATIVGASDGRDFVVAWTENREGLNLYTLRIPAGGAVDLTPRQLTPSKLIQSAEAMLWTGDSYALVWQEAFVDGSGQNQRISPLDRAGSLLGTAVIGAKLNVLGAELAGNELLLAFASTGGTFTQRFNVFGDPISERMLITREALPAILAPTEIGFALLYQRGETVTATLLDRLGNRASDPLIVFKGDMIQLTDAIFARGTTWLAWTAPAAVTNTSQPLRRALTGEITDSLPPGRRRPSGVR